MPQVRGGWIIHFRWSKFYPGVVVNSVLDFLSWFRRADPGPGLSCPSDPGFRSGFRGLDFFNNLLDFHARKSDKLYNPTNIDERKSDKPQRQSQSGKAALAESFEGRKRPPEE